MNKRKGPRRKRIYPSRATQTSKRCPVCEDVKPFAMFRPNSMNSLTGLRHICRLCDAKHAAQVRAAQVRSVRRDVPKAQQLVKWLPAAFDNGETPPVRVEIVGVVGEDRLWILFKSPVHKSAYVAISRTKFLTIERAGENG